MLKEVEMELQKLEGFENPEARLEQYETPAPLASRLLHLGWSRGDLDGWVLDLGCGTGMLGIGAALYGAHVVGVDIDENALRTARKNAAKAGVSETIDWVRGEVSALPIKHADTVVMNPPFGAQKRSADRPFLREAENVANVVYTVHNEGSRDFVESFIDGEITDAFETTVSLKHKFDFHEDEERETVVEVYRIE